MSTMQIYLDAMRHAKRTSQRAREQIANILLRENNARVADFTESMAQMPIIRYADEELLLKEGVTQCVSCGVVLGDVQRCGDACVCGDDKNNPCVLKRRSSARNARNTVKPKGGDNCIDYADWLRRHEENCKRTRELFSLPPNTEKQCDACRGEHWRKADSASKCACGLTGSRECQADCLCSYTLNKRGTRKPCGHQGQKKSHGYQPRCLFQNITVGDKCYLLTPHRLRPLCELFMLAFVTSLSSVVGPFVDQKMPFEALESHHFCAMAVFWEHSDTAAKMEEILSLSWNELNSASFIGLLNLRKNKMTRLALQGRFGRLLHRAFSQVDCVHDGLLQLFDGWTERYERLQAKSASMRSFHNNICWGALPKPGGETGGVRMCSSVGDRDKMAAMRQMVDSAANHLVLQYTRTMYSGKRFGTVSQQLTRKRSSDELKRQWPQRKQRKTLKAVCREVEERSYGSKKDDHMAANAISEFLKENIHLPRDTLSRVLVGMLRTIEDKECKKKVRKASKSWSIEVPLQ